jgi:hypothetical protein
MSIRSARDALAATYTTPEPSPNTPDGPQCLRWVWLCFGSVQSNLPPLMSVAFAKQGWIYSKMQHPGDRNPPAGAPLYFSGSDGHICIATGQGEGARSTEWPWGHVGDTSISAIEKAWGRTYYGWTGDMLGHPITFDASTAGGNATPIPNQEVPDMDTTQAAQLAAIYNTLNPVAAQLAAIATNQKETTVDSTLTLIQIGQADGTQKWALTGPGYWVDVDSQTEANQLSLKYGHQVECTDATWAAFKTASGK